MFTSNNMRSKILQELIDELPQSVKDRVDKEVDELILSNERTRIAMRDSMTKEAALEILERHNEWRNGGEIPMLNPNHIGIAIDKAIEVLRLSILQEGVSSYIYDKQYTLRLCGINVWMVSLGDGIGSAQIFGKGVHWKDTTKHKLRFSERNGYKKALNIGKWRLSLLR